MQEMGFNKNSSDSAKEAFIKYLIKQSASVNVQTPSEKKTIENSPQKIVCFPKQLEFAFNDIDIESEASVLKKA